MSSAQQQKAMDHDDYVLQEEDEEEDYELLMAKYLSMKEEGEFSPQKIEEEKEGESTTGKPMTMDAHHLLASGSDAGMSMPTTPSTLDPDSPAFAAQLQQHKVSAPTVAKMPTATAAAATASTPPSLLPEDYDVNHVMNSYTAGGSQEDQGGFAAPLPPSARTTTNIRNKLDDPLLLCTDYEDLVDCTKCTHYFRHETDRCPISDCFPVPTKHEVLLSLIGCVDSVGTERPTKDVTACLKTLETLLQIALRESEEICLDFLEYEGERPELEDDEEEDTESLIHDIHKCGATIKGWIDFVIACGFEREGASIKFWRPDPRTRPCKRVVIGLQLVREELDALENCNGRRIYTAPLMAQIGPKLTLFGELEKKVDSSYYFPTHLDVMQWVDLRNFFYLCYLQTSASSDDEQSETWLHYFTTCRNHCQEVLNAVTSKHATLRVDTSLTRLTSDGDMVQRLVERLGKVTKVQDHFTSPSKKATATSAKDPKEVLCMTPPTQAMRGGAFAASPQTLVSPGDLLLRTPQGRIDRECYKMSAPAPDGWVREDPTQPVGLLNMRQCCYMNSLVQVLSAVPGLTPMILQKEATSSEEKDKDGGGVVTDVDRKIFERLRTVLAYLNCSSCTCVNPIPLLESVVQANPTFGDMGQHDPHEFAVCLLDAVNAVLRQQDETNSTSPVQASQLSDVWGCAINETAFDMTKDKKLELQPEDEETNETENVATATAAALSLEAASSLIPLYFVEDVEQQTSGGSAATMQHKDPNALDFGEPMAGQEKLTQSLPRSLGDFLLETRPGAKSGVARRFKSATGEAPPSLMFYLPTRTSGVPGCDQPFHFADSLDLSHFLLSSGGQTQEDRHSASTSLPPKAHQEVLFHKLRMEALEQDLKQASLACAETKKVVELSGFAALPTALQEQFTSCHHAAVKHEVDCREQLGYHRTKFLAAQPSLFQNSEVEEGETSAAANGQYCLMGVVVHVGDSVNFGHYFSFVRKPKQEKATTSTEQIPSVFAWYLCDDSSTREVSNEVVLGDECARGVYCLLYVREDLFTAELSRFTEAATPKIDTETTSTETTSATRLPLGTASTSANHNQQVVPANLRALVAKEDARKQDRMIQRMSMA